MPTKIGIQDYLNILDSGLRNLKVTSLNDDFVF
jgi:hypothetical protein